MDQPIHLVFVNGLADPRQHVNGSVKLHFSRLFPRAFIDEFSLLQPTKLDWHLRRRAQALLEQVSETFDPGKPLPIVFLAHGLGGLVVKEALMLAVEKSSYPQIVIHTAAVFFFCTPHRASADLSWEHLSLRLVSALPSVPRHSLKFVDKFVEEVETSTAISLGVPLNVELTNYYEAGNNSVVHQSCSTLPKGFGVNISFECSHQNFWDFGSQEDVANDVVKRLLATRHTKYSQSREFLLGLSTPFRKGFQLLPSYCPSHEFDDSNYRDACEAWKNDPKASVLRINGAPGSDTATLARKILSDMIPKQLSEDVVILSFKFDKNNAGARSSLDFYLSMCRQLLISRPQTFGRVLPAADFWKENGELASGSLWVLFRSMLTSLLDQEVSVFCIICDVNQCISSAGETIDRMQALANTEKGRFNVLLTVDAECELPSGSGQQIQDVKIEPGSYGMSQIIDLHIRSNFALLSQQSSAWCGLEDLVVDHMKSLPQNSPYLVAKLNMILLGWTTKGCTRKELEQKLQHAPKSLTECYKEALLTISDRHRSWALTLLRWIARAVRPLSQHELSVAGAISQASGTGRHRETSDKQDQIEDMIHLEVAETLQSCMAPLIKFQDSHAYFVHGTFREFFIEHGAQCGADNHFAQMEEGDEAFVPEDDDCWILRQCFEYLSKVGKRAMTLIQSHDRHYISSLHREYGLLSYATLYWPQHFQQSRTKEASKEQVLNFFRDKEQLATWIALYKGLQTSVTALTCKRTDVDTLLKIVCYYGLNELVETCIESSRISLDFDSQKSECLDLAAQRGHHGIVQLLLEKGASSINALSLAAEGEFYDLCETILKSDTEAINRPGKRQRVPLHWATSAGSYLMVSFLLAKNADPNFPSAAEHSETPLHLAAVTGQKEIAQCLLERGANLHQRSSRGYDALIYAAWGGSHEIVSLLLSRDADASVGSDLNRNTALHLAAENGHSKVVEILIKELEPRPELLRMSNKTGLAPIHLAAREGHLKALGLLLDALESTRDAASVSEMREEDQDFATTYSNDGDEDDYLLSRSLFARLRMRHRRLFGWTPRTSRNSVGSKSAVEWAVENGQYEVVSALLAKRTTVPRIQVTRTTRDEADYTVLHHAAEKGYSSIVELILKDLKYARLFPVDDQAGREQLTPMHLASKKGYTDIIRILLRYGASPNLGDEEGRTALHFAAEHGHLSCLNELLPKSDMKTVDQLNCTALHVAAKNGHFDVVERLCEDSDIIWMENGEGNVALDLIAENCSFDQVKSFVTILRNRADGENFTARGRPLHAAARRGNTDVLRFLIDEGWDCEATISTKGTPLHVAVQSGSMEVVEMLLGEFHCDVDAVDVDGDSPIHCARDAGIVKTLLRFKAKYDGKNTRGQTPLFLAAYRQQSGIVDILLKLDPKPDVNAVDSDQWSILHAAYDSSDITNSLLKHHPKTEVITKDGRTPLAMAVQWGHLETAKFLLNAGASPDHAGSDDKTPLALAYTIGESENRLQITKLLIKHGADLQSKVEGNNTVLDLAAREGEEATVDYIIKTLLEQGLPSEKLSDLCASALYLHVSSRENFTPEIANDLASQGHDTIAKQHPDALAAACEHGSVDAVKWLLEQIAPLEESSWRYGKALHAAVKSEYDAEEKVSKLLEHLTRIDINDCGQDQPTAIQQAAYNGNEPLVQLLLHKGADVRLVKGQLDTLLNCAIANSDISISTINEILTKVDKDQAPGVKGRFPVHQAAIHGRADVIKDLRDYGLHADVQDEEGLSPLMYGLIDKNTSIVDYLLSVEGYKLEDADANGLTPLMTATILDDVPNLKSLLKNGFKEPAVLNAQDYQEKTALSYASYSDRPELVEILLEHGADPTAVDCRGNGPLYWATRMAGRGMMENLIGAMDKPNSDRVEHLNTAIHGAVASNKREALELLLNDFDVNPDYKRSDGWTPLYTASKYGFGRIQSLLEDVLIAADMPSRAPLQRPSRWHPKDKHPGISIDDDNKCALKSVGTTGLLNKKHHSEGRFGIARADHPMLPLIKDQVYYFEVKLIASVGEE
ncbi:hypothetical protein FNYG_15628 [Fusarium nygamai]|uniref:Nephrocystin 3-like N-terminal domain-containing protein n=1 Tax=Gibberella nygamai TaxID=42673 RepID=A0A2K0U9I9_GIBNY|nr:hypothetical protein FNYG_15628 [Fusarium nygamai]